MIINVRGTHGSGKTTLVRAVMAQYTKCRPVAHPNRRNPIGYICDRTLFVPGHYEGDAVGGCDTIKFPDLMFELIHKYASRGLDVLFEGIVAQHSVPRVLALRDAGHRVRIVQLNIPIAKAIRGVQRRRDARGETRTFDTTNTVRELQAIRNSAVRLKAAGVRVTLCSTRQMARAKIFHLLDLS